MVGYLFVTLEQTRPEEDPRTQCVQRLDESLGCAVHVNYRILPRSSSFREPRYPLLEVMVVFFLPRMNLRRDGKRKRIFKMIKPQEWFNKKNDLFFNEVLQFSHHRILKSPSPTRGTATRQTMMTSASHPCNLIVAGIGTRMLPVFIDAPLAMGPVTNVNT
jgi:hypothetical protein